MPEMLITNARIVDGTGKPSFKGNIAISGDKILSVAPTQGAGFTGTGDETQGKTVINAEGFAVAPGFIDCHSHFEWMLPLQDHETFLYPGIEQGITTVVGGNCGFSPTPVSPGIHKQLGEMAGFIQEERLSFEWESMGGFIDHLNSGDGLLFNNANLLGHGPLHLMTVGDMTAQPDADHVKEMVRLAEIELDEGAYGISFGLMYPPGIFSRKKDLTALARVAAEQDRILTVHNKALSRYSMAYPIIPFIGTPHNLKALDEIIDIGLETGVKLQISHLIFVGKNTWGTLDKIIDRIERARDKGLRIMWDIYPHFCGNSYLTVFIPEWFLKNMEENLKNPWALRRMKLESKLAAGLLGFKLSDIQIMDANYPEGQKYNGMNLEQIGIQEGLDTMDVLLKIVRESHGQALQLTYGYSGDEENEWLMEKMVAHDLTLFETDTLLKKGGFANPASYGAFPRILGRYVREKSCLSLEDAVSKMTGRTARRFEIKDRGEITPGSFADLVLFDPATIGDRTTRADTSKRPAGIEKVFVNGKLVVDGGEYLKGKKAGRALKCQG